MQKGFRLEGQIGDDRSPRTVKTIWEYTPGNIIKSSVGWMTDKAPNADMLTREGDEFDKVLKSAKKVMTVAIPEIQMRISPYTEKQYIEKYKIFWYPTDSKGAEDFWRMIVFYHVKIGKVTKKDFGAANAYPNNGNYYEVVMQIEANIDYLDKYGTKAQ